MNSHSPVLALKSSRRQHHSKTNIIVVVARVIVVAVGRTAVARIIVVGTAAQQSGVSIPSSRSRKEKIREYLLSQSPGISVFEVSFPRLKGLNNIKDVFFSFGII